MSELIGRIVKYMVDFIQELLASLKLKNLELELARKKEISNDKVTNSTALYNDFSAEYATWLRSDSNVSGTVEEVRVSGQEPARSDSKPRRSGQGKRGRRRRTKGPAKRRKR